MKSYRIDRVAASRVPLQSCIDVVAKAAGLTDADQITSAAPPNKLGNLSLNVYASAADSVILHFCNASNAETITPAGAYSFMAMH
jgi:hypothetical protein